MALEHDAPRRGEGLLVDLGLAGGRRRVDRPRGPGRLHAAAARRRAALQRRLPPGREVQGRRGAAHARRAVPRGARVADERPRRHARGVVDTLASSRRRRSRRSSRTGPGRRSVRRSSGSIDEVGYFDEALAEVKKQPAPCASASSSVPGAEEQEGDLDELVRALAGESSATGPIALVRATGSISMSAGAATASSAVAAASSRRSSTGRSPSWRRTTT